MSWFSDLIEGGSKDLGINWNPGDSPLWTNTNMDPTKGSFGKEGAKLAGAMNAGAMGTLLGGPAGTVVGAKYGWDAGDKLAAVPFQSSTPTNNVNNTAPRNMITSSSVGKDTSKVSRALEEQLRSQKRAELPKNIEQTFNLESSLASKGFGQGFKK